MPLKHGSSPSPGSHGIITLLTDNRLESFLQSSVSFAEQTLSGNHQTVRTYEFHSPWPMNSTPSRLLSPTISNLTRSSSIPYYKKYTRNVVPPIPLSLRVVCEQQSWERSRSVGSPPPQLPSVNVQYALTSTTTSGFAVVGETVEKRDVKLRSGRGERRWRNLKGIVDHQGHGGKKDPPPWFVCGWGKTGKRLSVYGRAPGVTKFIRAFLPTFLLDGIFLGSLRSLSIAVRASVS